MQTNRTGWKALILAAGFGTRLLPYTRHTPKPLFTINNRPLLDIIIDRLIRSGCGGIIINTHHLADRIESFLASQQYQVPVHTRYEPEILGTGGAMRNVADILDEQPFMVINSDIYTDINLADVYVNHEAQEAPVTLVLHDHATFNSVFVDKEDCITGFAGKATAAPAPDARCLAFTGIHVMDPGALAYIPKDPANVDIIGVYRDMIQTGIPPRAQVVENHHWHDIGTPVAYRQTAFDRMARAALEIAFGETGNYTVSSVAPDGADTRWYRIAGEKGTLVACDRGIRASYDTTEAESFFRIGRHLYKTTGAVPRIYLADGFAGLIFMEDLGDIHLQTTIRGNKNTDIISSLYQVVIDRLVELATAGYEGFDPAWACQTPAYDRSLILEKECDYFARAFLMDYLGMADMTADLAGEFERLADMTIAFAVEGLMHRDMQSRNILVKDNQPYFIDFQGARSGPIQYDLAALLIDPYAALPDPLKHQLVSYYRQKLTRKMPFDEAFFNTGYACCAVTRNLQILGAFGFLTCRKNKPWFSAYIPHAAAGLLSRLKHLENVTNTAFPRLTAVTGEALTNIRDKY